MELVDRKAIETAYAREIGRVFAAQRRLFEDRFAESPEIPEETWEDDRKEITEVMLLFGLTIALLSFIQHGGSPLTSDDPAFDSAAADSLAKTLAKVRPRPQGFNPLDTGPPAALRGGITERATEIAGDIVAHSRDLLRDFQGRIESEPESVNVRDISHRIYGPHRAAVIATTETTRGQHFGSETAVAGTVGISQDDLWFTVRDRRVCPVCEPLHGRPRSYWGRFYAIGPPDPHAVCRCYIQYANLGEGVQP